MRSLPLKSGAAVSSAFLLLLASGCDARTAAQEPAQPHRVRVRVAQVEARELAPPVVASGVVVDASARTLSFPVGGVLADVRVDDGDTVRRGQVLARLELDTVNAQLSQASAALERAERDLTRAETLARTGSIPSQSLDDARTQVRVSQADAQAAGFARRHAVLVAPGDGVVLARALDPGETVGQGTPVLTLALDGEARVVRVSVTDREIVRLRDGDEASVVLDAYPGRALRGTISRLAAAADPATGLHAVEVSVPELAELRATAGLVARVSLHAGDASRVFLVPASALVDADEREATVWAVASDGRRAEAKRVHIAFLTGDRVALGAGLDGVARVVTDGATYVRARSVLDIRDARGGAR